MNREARMRFIEVLLEHYGTINRKLLEDYFELSTPQVSLDFQHYQAHAPLNMEYDKSSKCYRRGPFFQRVWCA